jgi:glycosyltransferase involved in cell wall biosynthesis
MPIRLLLICTHPKQYTGYSKVVYEILKELVKYPDLLITVYGFQKFFNVEDNYREIESKNLFIYDAATNENPKDAGFGINQIVEFVKINNPDVIFVYNDLFIVSNFLNVLNTLKNKNFKTIAYIDQVYPFQKDSYIDIVNNNVDLSLVFTNYWKDIIMEQNLRTPCKIFRHGFDNEVFYPIDKIEARKALMIPQDHFIILNLNRNQPRKRYDILLIAYAKFISMNPDEQILLIVGCMLQKEWDLLEILKRELARYNIHNFLDYIKAVDEPQNKNDEYINLLYNASDIGINTCDGEGFGLCNFEHAGVGRPQIINHIGGFLDFFDNENSIPIKPKWRYYVDSTRDSIGGEASVCDPDDVAEAMNTYFKDDKLRNKHGKAARLTILKYKWEDEVKTLYNCIKELVN